MTKVRLFISHFKKIVLFMVVVTAVIVSMNYLYVDDTDEFARYMLHEFYEEEENIDRLYIGTSHVFCGVNPVLLDEINGDNNFNLATGTQQLIASYYLLREADRIHNLDKVYLELYYDCTVGGKGNVHDPSTFPYSWLVLNQMKPSLNKLTYILDLSEPAYYYMSFLPFMRYKEQLFNKEYVARVFQAKQSEIWKNYEYRHITRVDDREYVMKDGEKGFRICDRTPEQGGFFEQKQEEPLDENPITEESLEYLLKITEYCEEQEIDLVWIGYPLSDYQLVRKGEYDNYIRQLSDLAKQYQVPYYDFNLCKREYLDLSQNSCWSDMGHLNTAGAELFTKFLGRFLLAQEAGDDIYQDCFYNSYEEKIRDSQDKIYGLEIVRSQDYECCMPEISEEERDKYVIYKARPVTNADVGDVVIKVNVEDEDADLHSDKKNAIIETIQDGNDTYVVLTAEQQGNLCVEARLKDAEDVTNWARIEL